MRTSQGLTVLAVVVLLAVSACKEGTQGTEQTATQTGSAQTTDKPAAPTADVPKAPPIPELPLGLLPTPSPQENPTTPEKVALGELLFFDKRISDKGNFSCETCHVPEKGWTDGLALSPKADGAVNKRHSPTLYNVAYATAWYWDGRKATLEDQILAAWTGQTGATPDKVAAKLAAIPEYKVRFQRAFNEDPTGANIPKALAAFVRIKIRSGNAPWDQYEAGNKSAVSDDAVKGYEVFKKSGCASCHAPPLFTDMNYHNVGIGYKGVEKPDVGRFSVSKIERDTGAFKTPGLRSVTLSGPYFHDGSIATLEEAVDFMLQGGYREGNKHIDPLLKPVQLSSDERTQLLAFIGALTPKPTPYQRPKLP